MVVSRSLSVLFPSICVLGISDKPSGLIHDDPLGGAILFSVLLLTIVRHLQLRRLFGKV